MKIDREGWRARTVGRSLPWDRGAIRPAEVINTLRSIMLDPRNQVEDAGYLKYSPNCFVVELGENNYRRNYQPLERRITGQWQDQLQSYLVLANERLGRAEYRLAGPRLEIRAAPGMPEDRACVFYCLDPNAVSLQRELASCLEWVTDGRRWRLRQGLMTIGRDPSCDIYLDSPAILSTRLVSSRHAYLVCSSERCRLVDGDPGGHPSLNGTYVNGRPIVAGGQDLRDGDLIQLAAASPGQPQPDAPGIALLRFVKECS